MHFLSCFLHEFGQGDKSVEDAMNKSYGQTLKRYHGWITRGLFSVIIILNSFENFQMILDRTSISSLQ
jgi:hypothetical protein